MVAVKGNATSVASSDVRSNAIFAASMLITAIAALGEIFGLPTGLSGALLTLSIAMVAISALFHADSSYLDARMMFFVGVLLFAVLGPLLAELFETYAGDFSTQRNGLALVLSLIHI